jgi:hypothetical protein
MTIAGSSAKPTDSTKKEGDKKEGDKAKPEESAKTADSAKPEGSGKEEDTKPATDPEDKDADTKEKEGTK